MQEQADDEEEQQGVGYYKCTHYMLAEWLMLFWWAEGLYRNRKWKLKLIEYAGRIVAVCASLLGNFKTHPPVPPLENLNSIYRSNYSWQDESSLELPSACFVKLELSVFLIFIWRQAVSQ